MISLVILNKDNRRQKLDEIGKTINEEGLIDVLNNFKYSMRQTYLVVDERWTDHIDAMDQLRQSISLRGYGQLNPLVEYQEAGYRMFEEMISNIEFDATRLFMKAQIRQNISR